MQQEEASSKPPDSAARLRRFLHDLAVPLSAVALHLESASRDATKGKDPSESLETARRELAKAFDLFDRGRAEILTGEPGSKALAP